MRSARDRIDWLEASNGGNCFFFALVPLIAGVIADVAADVGLGAVLGADIIGGVTGSTVLAGGLVGAGGGALLGGLTGGAKGAELGALTGGITGGALSFGPAIGAGISSLTGIGAETGATIGDVIAGAGGGVLGSVVTGQSPLTGLETGGVAGLAAGLTSGIGGNAPTSGTGTSAQGVSPGGVGAATAPASVSTPATSLTASSGASGAAFGDLGPTLTAPELGAQTGTGTGGAGNISGGTGGGAASISGPTPDLSIGPTAAQQSATLGGITSPAGAPGYAATGNIVGPTGQVVGPTGDTDILGTVENKIGDYISNPKNLLSAAIGGAGLINELGQKSTEQQQVAQLQDAATSASSMARAAEAPLFSGVLPIGAQDALNVSRDDQIAQIRSTYASMGMAGSTGEADAIGAVDQNIAAQQYSIEGNLFAQAEPFAAQAATDLGGVVSAQQTMDQNFSNALSRFVASITGSTAGTPSPTQPQTA